MHPLFMAWQSPIGPLGWRPMGRLERSGELFRFYYTQGAKREGLRCFVGMEQLDCIYESDDLLPVFANRLMRPSREEYPAYLRWCGFDPKNPPDPLAILGVTEGLRATDRVEVFPCPISDPDGCYSSRIFIHGVRLEPNILGRIEGLERGEPLKLVVDLERPNDLHAVDVWTKDESMKIGRVPRYLAYDIWNSTPQRELDFIDLSVASVNRDAPLQNRLLCHLKIRWPNGFRPCSGNEFLPIPNLT